jgi:hypothetical protein
MSALPPIADIPGRNLNVRFVPKADITTAGTGIYLHRQNIAEAHDVRRITKHFPPSLGRDNDGSDTAWF